MYVYFVFAQIFYIKWEKPELKENITRLLHFMYTNNSFFKNIIVGCCTKNFTKKKHIMVRNSLFSTHIPTYRLVYKKLDVYNQKIWRNQML